MLLEVLAATPIILVILLLFLFRKPLVFASPITFIYTLLLGAYYWQVRPVILVGSVAKGFLVAVDIIIIIFGALVFLEFLKKTGLLESIEYYLSRISPDKRIQMIILAWFLGSFIEGTAGFGTPAAIVAPLLVGLGFPAITSVAVALIANSTAVAFGAVGTPIRIGFEGLEVTGVAQQAGLINLFAGAIIPVMLLFVLVYGVEKRFSRNITEAVPFALWAGFCLTIPYYFFTFLGQEFPSLLGPLVGLVLVSLTTKLGWFVPKNTWTISDAKKKISLHGKEPLLKVFMPYILLIGFLIIGKFTLTSYPFTVSGPITHSLNPYNPGFAFLLALVVYSLLYNVSFANIAMSAKQTVKILLVPFTVIFFIAGFVQLMMHSGNNYTGLESMINVLAGLIEVKALPFLAPFIGGFGSFIAGSATVSNLLFGQFQATAAANLGLSVASILALQLVGAGIGNMLALTNIVAAQATVKLKNREAEIFLKTLIPSIIYAVIAGIIGLILVYVF